MKTEISKKYHRLICLAKDLESPHTSESIRELNVILSEMPIDLIDPNDFSLIDDLICILHNTGNIEERRKEKIVQLQDSIRESAI